MEQKTHTPRIDFKSISPAVVSHMMGFTKLLDESGLEVGLRDMIKVRASQINGCALCLDMHVHEAREHGISDDRLHLLNAWRDTNSFSNAERAALALTEAVTRITEGGVPDALYKEVREYYTADQYIGLLTTINAINAWNRLMIGVAASPPVRK